MEDLDDLWELDEDLHVNDESLGEVTFRRGVSAVPGEWRRRMLRVSNEEKLDAEGGSDEDSSDAEDNGEGSATLSATLRPRANAQLKS